jgi:hypothetical protein
MVNLNTGYKNKFIQLLAKNEKYEKFKNKIYDNIPKDILNIIFQFAGFYMYSDLCDFKIEKKSIIYNLKDKEVSCFLNYAFKEGLSYMYLQLNLLESEIWGIRDKSYFTNYDKYKEILIKFKPLKEKLNGIIKRLNFICLIIYKERKKSHYGFWKNSTQIYNLIKTYKNFKKRIYILEDKFTDFDLPGWMIILSLTN